jgi:hypothetical protein
MFVATYILASIVMKTKQASARLPNALLALGVHFHASFTTLALTKP